METQDINEKLGNFMGWPTITENTPLRNVTQYGGYILDGQCYKFTIGYGTEKIDFCNNLNHAFMCVDKIMEKGLNVRLHNNKYLKEPWVFAILDENYNKIVESNSNNRAQAICNCLINALGGQNEK